MKFLFLLLISSAAFAKEKDCEIKKPSPSPIMSTPTPTPIFKKPAPKPRPSPMPTPVAIHVQSQFKKEDLCCDNKSKNNNQNQNLNKNSATTGNQTTIIKIPNQRDRVIIREKVKTKVKNNYYYNPNRIQFMLGLSKNKLEIIEKDCCAINAKNNYQPDLGIQYIRDFSLFSGSVMGTARGNLYLGLGFNF